MHRASFLIHPMTSYSMEITFEPVVLDYNISVYKEYEYVIQCNAPRRKVGNIVQSLCLPLGSTFCLLHHWCKVCSHRHQYMVQLEQKELDLQSEKKVITTLWQQFKHWLKHDNLNVEMIFLILLFYYQKLFIIRNEC